ncbi:hypothetical protein LSTR_LSTR003006 [Laodelphax striatellus]|uniref:CHCH domain-containing protein n=1 Tax=Laodelphax striatellus TaxID=195883 RepID=A0A482XU87_LAOST|nr:hypothetical protein LSTR_LSTR003006 [Laodelphax striatellus]
MCLKMGSQESTTRKISIENDEQPEIEVLTSSSHNIEPENINNPANVVAQNINYPCPERPKNETSSEIPTEDSPGKRKELSEKELNLQYMETLKTNKENWNRKIQDLKEKHKKIYSDYIVEYQKAVDFVEEHSPKERKKNAVVPCNDIKEKVLKCYKENKTEALVCSLLVQEFMKCLDGARCDVLEKK